MTQLVRLEVRKGEEVIETLTAKAAEAEIRNGAVVSLIGAVESCCISNMPTGDATDNILTEYSQPFELSGTGEIVDGRVHLHVSASGEGNSAIHGHLHWANVNTWFVYAHVMELPGQ